MHARTSLAFVTVALVLAAGSASARTIRVDIGPTFNTQSGGLWDELQYPDLSASQNSLAVSIGFSIDFGAGPTSSLFINQNGFVSFGAPVDFNSAGVPAGSNVIAPYYDTLSWSALSTPSTFFEPDTVSYSQGIVAQTSSSVDLDGNPVYAETDAHPAIRVTWNQVSDGADTISAQLVLINRTDISANAFDIELNYEQFLTTATPLFAGFQLGTFSANYAGPFNGNGDTPTYAFRGGVYVPGGTTTPPTQVPEPSTLALLLLGLGALALRRIRTQAFGGTR